MALIKCPECGREISDFASSCPGCGISKANMEKLRHKERCSRPTIAALQSKDRKYSAAMDIEEKGKCLKCRIEYDRHMYLSCPLCEMQQKLQDKTKENVLQLQKYQGNFKRYLRKGDEVEFGEFDGNAITWIVLDTVNNKVMLMAKYGLAYMPFNDKMWSVSWEKCSMRKYLNDEFIHSCFDEKEQSVIIESSIENKGNSRYGITGCGETKDKVFLLSLEEAGNLLATDTERLCSVAEYVFNSESSNGESKNGYWWLRSPGRSDSSAAVVRYDGTIADYGNYVAIGRGIVRPAMWIKME